MSGPVPGDLLGSIPFGGLLAGLWRVLLAADRREEFVGDLVEQASADLPDRAPAEISLWLFGQTLHSAPSLLVARARRLARAARFSGGTGTRVATGMPGLLMSSRAEQRSWSLPMAVSLSTHAIALGALFAFTVGQMEEIETPWVQVALKRAFAPAPPTVAMAVPAPEQPEPRRPRRPRATPKVVAPAAQLVALPLPAPAEVPVEVREVVEVVVTVPPAVSDKRCLSCPQPKLPPAFARLGARQQMVVKTCVGSNGSVTSVDVLRGLSPAADAGVVDTVRSWRFEPHAVDDHPVPFCYPTRFLFSMN